MLLFLDIISPIPEFCVIEDNKVILNRKIVSNNSDKLSDNIVETYIEINKYLNLRDNLKKIVITTGPGSYTSLRVGIAFVSGLKLSIKLKISSLSVNDILKFNSKKYNINSLGIFINSGNHQKFLCWINNTKKINYLKIDNNKDIFSDKFKIILYNHNQLEINKSVLVQKKFYFVNELLDNIKDINFTDNSIIRPIYVSNNAVLN